MRERRERPRKMTERIVFDLNGKTQTVEVAPDTPLLYVLRNELGLNNPHFGCGLAQCGACTVHVDGAPTRSCSLPVSAAAGTKVTTLAGLGQPRQAAPAAGGLYRRAGAAMRLLPQRLDHDRGRAAARHPAPLGAADPRRARRAQMPLRYAYGDPARRPARGAGGVGEGAMTYLPIDRRTLFKGSGAL